MPTRVQRLLIYEKIGLERVTFLSVRPLDLFPFLDLSPFLDKLPVNLYLPLPAEKAKSTGVDAVVSSAFYGP